MMSNFFSKLFGKAKATVEQNSAKVECHTPDSKQTSRRREPPTDLDLSQAEYIPLPPSPPTWEVDGRDEFNRSYNDPLSGPVLQAGFKNQYSKVVKLASKLSAGDQNGSVGEVIAKAYTKLIIQRMKAGQFAAAAKQCMEMFECVPDYIKDVDRRRFNRILVELDKAGKKHNYYPVEVVSPTSQPLFTLSEDAPWQLVDERELKRDERPEPAFKIVSIDSTGTWLLDRSGSSVSREGVKCVLRRISRRGLLVGEKALMHDAYLTGTCVSGESIAIMDSGGVLYVYNASLDIIAETNLREDPRVVDHFRTIDTNYWGEFKSQVRAVDVAPAGDRYLFTLADEAWCCTNSGIAVWGLAVPLREGWKRLVVRSERFGVAQEVDEALRLLGLSLPVSPIEIKRKYRALALASHPDLNAGDPAATERMKALNRAFEILTGVDPNTLEFEESDVTYFARSAPDQVIETEQFRLGITVSGGPPQDWIYAASFAGGEGAAYLATYSGKVILVSPERQPAVVYDIGTCPNEIINVGRFTYFLTSTRLYVVEDRTKLTAFLDVFQQGRLLVSNAGFGLLTSKRLQWFTEAGVKVGELKARDPIRAIYATDDFAVVQTRQHQVRVEGLAI